jgi:hypothetical protein
MRASTGAAFTALISLTLSGCHGPWTYHPTMAADPTALPEQGQLLVTELRRAITTIPASAAPTCVFGTYARQERDRPGVESYRAERLRQNNPAVPPPPPRKDKAGKPIAPPPAPYCYAFRTANQAEVGRHVRAGFALTDYYCDIFFERISEHAGKRRFARALTNDVGAVISTILGLTSVGSGITGGVGAGFGFVDSSFRNYDESFLVNADLPTLQKLVRAEQLKLRNETYSAMPKTYPDATIAILRYAQTCTFNGMRGLLTESMVEKAQREANTFDGQRILDSMKAAVARMEQALAVAKAPPPASPVDAAANAAAAADNISNAANVTGNASNGAP